MIRVLKSLHVGGAESDVLYQELAGTSSDTKPTEHIASGSTFIEADTGVTYIYDESSGQWN